MRWWNGVRLVLLGSASLATVVLTSCYEVPPEVPERHGPRKLPGWPVPAVYTADAFHPVHRWFHRSFARRGPDGSIAGVSTSAAFSAMLSPDPLDRQEISALLEAIDVEHASVERHIDGVSRALFVADLVAQSRVWARLERAEIARIHVDLANRFRGSNSTSIRKLAQWTPPPLREGRWRRVSNSTLEPADPESSPRRFEAYYETSAIEAGGDGSSRPISGSRVVDSATPGRAVLTFTIRDADGFDVVNEAWELRAGEPSEFSVYRIDRELWRRTRRLWRRLDEDVEVAWELPTRPEREYRFGTLVPTCRACHSDDWPILSYGKDFVYGEIYDPEIAN